MSFRYLVNMGIFLGDLFFVFQLFQPLLPLYLKNHPLVMKLLLSLYELSLFDDKSAMKEGESIEGADRIIPPGVLSK